MKRPPLLNQRDPVGVDTGLMRGLLYIALAALVCAGCRFAGSSTQGMPSGPGGEPVASDSPPGSGETGTAISAVSATPADGASSSHIVRFPLTVAPTGSHLVDAAGVPFYIQGDAAWSLVAQLTPDAVAGYALTRSRQGFNTVMVNLVESHFSDHPPRNAEGTEPFLRGSNFTAPNPRYFDEAEALIRVLQDRGFLVLLAPAYLGYQGTDEGWRDALEDLSAGQCAEYGTFVASRFRDLRNIAWMAGGDMTPEKGSKLEACVVAMFEAISRADPDALITGHWAPETDSLAQGALAHMMDLNGVYTYGPVREACRQAVEHQANLPVFLLETGYDREHGITQESLRRTAYEAALSCPAGQVAGTGGVWQFSKLWQELLDSEATAAVSTASSTLRGLSWTAMPPRASAVLSGQAARANADGSTVLVYAGDGKLVVLHLEPVPAGFLAVWIDPINGARLPAAATAGPSGAAAFQPPVVNSVGGQDWALLLTAKRV